MQNYTFAGPDGNVHWYLINIPSTYSSTKAAPLIMNFHGRSESGSNPLSYTGYTNEAYNPYGITVFPTGMQASLSSDQLRSLLKVPDTWYARPVPVGG